MPKKTKKNKEEVEVLIPESDAELDAALEIVSIEDMTEDEIREVVPTLVEVTTEKRTPRAINFCGSLDEEAASAIISAMIYHNYNNSLVMINTEKTKQYMAVKPMQFYISTFGGNAADMFGIHDLMLSMRSSTPIETVGLGKVMSAGVLLLAAGTKGKRKIGRNCRVMIHAVSAGNMGSLHNLVNELDEIQNLQESYIDAIVENSSFTKKTLKRLLDRKVNVYLSAEEAIEHGIADEMI